MPSRSRRRYAPSARFSPTVRLRKIPRPSGACAIPRATSAWDGSCVTSSPRNRIVPADGRSILEMARRVVVLPAPFAPMSATTSPAGTSREIPRSASIAP